MSGNPQERWNRVRGLFDATCELPPERWSPTLEQLGAAPDEIAETLELLHAQTLDLGRVRRPLDGLLEGAEDPAVWVGQQLGPWRLRELIGSGGMGAVFLAERADQLYRRRVALKLLRRQYDPLLVERLATERQILADIQGRGIARLYDAGITDSGQPYLVMEHVEGRTLDVYAEGLDLKQRLQVFARICRIVQNAHAQLVVHCDLKPGNVLVDADGEPVLLDFGIARLLDAGGASSGAGYASPGYASPELLSGRAIGVASDVFSLGVMLTELLASRPLRRRLEDVDIPVPVASAWAGKDYRWRRRLYGDLDAIASHACRLDPTERYPSAEALADDIERWLALRPVRAREGVRLRTAWLGLRRHWPAALAATGMMVLGLGFVFRLDQARDDAEASAAIATQARDFLVAAFEAADPALHSGGHDATAREVLDRGAARIEADLATAPALQAQLRVVLGRAYQSLGQPRLSEQLLRRGVDGLKAAGQDDEAFEAESLLVLQMAKEGHYAEAGRQVAQLQEGVASGKRMVKPLLRLRLLRIQALVQAGKGEGGNAEASLLQALSVPRGNDPAWQREAMAALRELGDVYRNQGRLKDSARVLEQALEVTAARDGENGFEYQRGLDSLARTVFLQGHIDASVEFTRRSLALAERVSGEYSSQAAVAHTRLAGLYLDLGRYDESAGHFERGLQISARVDGEHSRAYAGKLMAFGQMEEARGDMARAEALDRQALSVYRENLGVEHPDTLEAEMLLARLLMRVGRLQEAGESLAQVARARIAGLAEDDPERRAFELVELEWWIRAGNHAAAEAALARLEPMRAGMPPWLLLRLQMQVALLAQRQQRWDEAVSAWNEVVESFSRLYGADSTATAKWRVPLAEVLMAAGKPDLARAQLQRARPRLAGLSPRAELLQRAIALEQALVGPAPER